MPAFTCLDCMGLPGTELETFESTEDLEAHRRDVHGATSPALHTMSNAPHHDLPHATSAAELVPYDPDCHDGPDGGPCESCAAAQHTIALAAARGAGTADPAAWVPAPGVDVPTPRLLTDREVALMMWGSLSALLEVLPPPMRTNVRWILETVAPTLFPLMSTVARERDDGT